MNAFPYKGYGICPDSHQLENGHWTHQIAIWRGSAIVRDFSSATTFETEQEAAIHGLMFGMQIIDGRCPDCSAADLSHDF